MIFGKTLFFHILHLFMVHILIPTNFDLCLYNKSVSLHGLYETSSIETVHTDKLLIGQDQECSNTE